MSTELNSASPSDVERRAVQRQLRRQTKETRKRRAEEIARTSDPAAWQEAVVLASVHHASKGDIARTLGLEIGRDTSLAIMRVVAKRLRREGLEASAQSSVGIVG